MMHHSIAVKFIALCLAALSLLAALGSAGCIIGMAAMDLYDNSVDELYNDSMHTIRQNFAVNLAHRYASLHIGNLSDQYLNDYFGLNWMYDTFRYGYFYYAICNEHGEEVESTMADAPEGGTAYEMAVTNIRYRALVEILPEMTPETESTTPPSTQAPEISGESATIPVTTVPSRASEIHYDSYYDHEQGKMVDFAFTYENLPPYTVTLYLLPGAMPEEYAWTLLRSIWAVRYELFYLLGFSLLLFAVFSVFLCVAAGRKKDTEEIRAGGLNCIPLDLYLVLDGLTICGCVVILSEVVGYLLRSAPKILVPVLMLGGFGCCLIFVSFCFACAAQFKTPNAYWWRNSLTGRCLRLASWLCGHFWSGCRWIFVRLPGFLRRFFRKLGVWGAALFRWTKKVCTHIFDLIRRTALWLWHLAKIIFFWFGRQLARLYSLLPLMWQWLLTAVVLLFLSFWIIRGDSPVSILIAAVLYLAIVIYGATAFGLLLESTKRMSRGVLKLRISDQFLIGSFREFAGDLNALAGVASLAAEKQLKSERMKTELITNVSHDIKTPLTSIINYVDLLRKPHTPEDEEAYLEVLARQSGQLKKLIDDLMEMSKASTGNLSVDIVSMDAAEAINQALGEFSVKLEKAQLIPVFRQPETPIYMKADGRLTWRVLSNLLNNAYKYALPGTRLYIDLEEAEGKVLISMKNISREELNVSAEELLERFVRGDVSRNTEGSGLGLNIAQSLMELQRGQLQLVVDGDLFKATLIFPAVRIE